MDKEDVVHTYNGILLSHIKEWNIAIFSNMDGPRDYHTKWSKLEKDKYIWYVFRFLHVESKKCNTRESIYKTKTQKRSKRTVIKRGDGEGKLDIQD